MTSYFMSFEKTKVTFINIEIERSYQRDTPIIEPDQTREQRSNSNSIYEKVRRSFPIKPTQLESKYHT